MGTFDAILLIIIAVFAFRGYLKGLVMELFGFIAIFVAFFVAYEYSASFGKAFGFFGFTARTNSVLGYAAAFIVTYILVFLLGLFLSRMFKEMKMGAANKGGGAVFGGFKAAAISGVILSMLLSTLPYDSQFSKSIRSGAITGNVAKLAPFVFDLMNKIPQVKKENPFEKTAFEKVHDKINESTEKVKDAVESVKDTAEKAGQAKEAVKDSAPLKDLQDEFQKN